MKNTKVWLFALLLLIYIAGISAGSIRQAKAENQTEMYEYLKNSVSGYEETAAKTIKSVAKDNLKLLIPLAAAGLFKAGTAVVGAAVLLKGYSAGFAVTAVLRVYGLKGIVLCGANVLSALCIIPATALYGCMTAETFIGRRYERGNFLKKYFFFLFALAAVFAADCFLRGFLSTVFMKYAVKIT